jgi:predicted ATPase
MTAITRVRFSNYRALRDAVFDLDDLTVLVGANACGKSSAMAGIAGPVEANDLTAGAHGCEPSVVTTTLDGLEVRNSATTPVVLGEVFRFDLDAMRFPIQLANAPHLEPTGRNLANTFSTIGRRQQQSIVEQYIKLVPVFSDVEARPLDRGMHRLVFQDRWTPSRYYEPAEVSDGSLLVLAFLVLHYQPEPRHLVCIEEPERGLHPWLLSKVIDLLRKMSRGEIGGRSTQIVMATQSGDVLNHVAPEEVRFFARDPESGDVTITNAPTDRPDWERTLDAYENSLGSLWLSGSVGGVPAE